MKCGDRMHISTVQGHNKKCVIAYPASHTYPVPFQRNLQQVLYNVCLLDCLMECALGGNGMWIQCFLVLRFMTPVWKRLLIQFIFGNITLPLIQSPFQYVIFYGTSWRHCSRKALSSRQKSSRSILSSASILQRSTSPQLWNLKSGQSAYICTDLDARGS